MQEWIKTTLGTYATINMGQSPESKYYNDEMIGLPFLQGNRTFGKRYPTIDTWTIKTTKIAHAGDVIMSVRAPVGDINITKQELCMGRGICSLSSRDPDNLFLYYLLKFNASNLINNETGSVFGSVNKDIIGSMQISLPDSQTRMKIGNILNTIDCCIELNSRINDYLADLVRTEFHNILKESGSDFVSFGSIIKVGSGGTPKTAIDGYWNGGIPFFSPKDVDGIFTMSTEKEISQNGLDNCNSMLYPKNTVFITARGTVGKIAMAGCDMAMNQSCYAIIGQKSDNQHYIHQLCLDMVDSIRQKSNGAVFDAINAKDIESEPIILLQEDTIEEFEKIATPIYEMIWTNESQNAKLRSVRDVLLPKLMSGEIDVSNLDLGS